MTEALTLLLYLSCFCLVLALAGWTADKVCKIVERMNTKAEGAK